jgi:hypothetical protein
MVLQTGQVISQRSTGWRIIRGLRFLTGLVSVICLFVIMTDLVFIAVLLFEKAHNAWYFPYSLFVLPVLVFTGPGYYLLRRALRRQGDDDGG